MDIFRYTVVYTYLYGLLILYNPEGPYTLPLWNQVPKDHPYNGFEGPNSAIVVHMDPLGKWHQRQHFFRAWTPAELQE